MDYNVREVQSAGHREGTRKGEGHERLFRKRYAVRVEFIQAGSIGEGVMGA